MKFKAGDIVVYKQGGISAIEGIIVKHWTEPNPWQSGTIDNIDLFITFDDSWPYKLHRVETYRDFNTKVWKLKK